MSSGQLGQEKQSAVCPQFWLEFNLRAYLPDPDDSTYAPALGRWWSLQPDALAALGDAELDATFADRVRANPEAQSILTAVNIVALRQIEIVHKYYASPAEFPAMRECFAKFGRRELGARNMDSSHGWIWWAAFLYAANALSIAATRHPDWLNFNQAVLEGYLNEAYIGKNIKGCKCPAASLLGAESSGAAIRQYVGTRDNLNLLKADFVSLAVDYRSSQCDKSAC